MYTELNFTTPLELLVRRSCRADHGQAGRPGDPDVVGPLPHGRGLAGADREELEEILRSTGFYHAKATSLMGLGQALCERFGGEVPGQLKDLVTLPGVGRKTANVVLGNAFGVPGITVDTHFGRLPQVRLDHGPGPGEGRGAGGHAHPEKDWTDLSQRMIDGRRSARAAPPARLRAGPPVPLLRRGAHRAEGGRKARQARPVLVTPAQAPSESAGRVGPVLAAPAGPRGRGDGSPGAARAARHRRQAVGRARPVRRRTERARLAVHPAQRRPPAARGPPAFPGGVIDDGDGGPVGAALREAAEEVGLDPGGVDVVGTLPEVFIERRGSGSSRCWPGGASRPRWAPSTRGRSPRWNASAWPNWPIPPPA